MAEEEKKASSPPTCSKLSPAASEFMPSYAMVLPSLAAEKLVAQTSAPLNAMDNLTKGFQAKRFKPGDLQPTAPSVATATGSGRGRGRPKKTPPEALNAAPQGKSNGSGRGRGRPKKTPPEALNAAPQGKSNGSGRGRGRPKKISSVAITEPSQEKKGRGRPKRTISVGDTATPLPTAPPVPTFPASSSAPPDFCTSSSIDGTTKRGMDSGRRNTTPFKRQRVVEMGVFQDENDLKVLNSGKPSNKIYFTGQAKVARSADVTVSLRWLVCGFLAGPPYHTKSKESLVLSNKDIENNIMDKTRSQEIESLKEKNLRLRQQMMRMYRAWASRLTPPPLPTFDPANTLSLPPKL
ncbi:hypothetical protein CQW23_18205 [Capsicum baccatum]|uniref:Uncharacterized protein n=1 Tax=Capsicum baccatum TaxID=33114 RepID=A0A2G2WGB8_CAPBA|nr:hypothetical protein CQW23_18205 [Capsicum baccatum]